jgi:putative hydrolase of the HAD superfamily
LANLGVYTHEEWLARVAELLVERYGPGAEAAVPLWDEDPGQLDGAMVALLRQIRAEGTQVGLLSNNTSALRRDLARHHISDLFEPIINSAEVEVVKPSPMIYRIAIDRMGAVPDEVIFVDDKLTNVLAARYVGVRAEQFVGIEPFTELLMTEGIPLPPADTLAEAAPPTTTRRAG